MPLQLTAIVVGAGIGGLATAVALRQAGHKVIVVEKHSDRREVGFAVSTSPNAIKVLQSLGVDLKTARMVHCTEQIIFQAAQRPFEITWRSSFADFEEKYGAPWMTVHRADLYSCLRDLATTDEGAGGAVPIEVIEGVSVVRFDPAGSVSLDNGEVLEADFVVAADGARSTAHEVIIDERMPATLTGSNHVRVCVPTQALMEDEELREFMDLAPDGISACSGTSRDRKVLRYPCRDNLLQNFGFHAHDDPIDERRPLKQVARERIRDFHPSIVRLIDYCNEDDMYLWRVSDRDPLPSYHKDRLIVLGDAAHPMLPTLGNGAGMAIEDAGALGVVMDGIRDVSEVPGRLEVWDRVRRPRASAVQLLSRSIGGVEYELSPETRDKVREYMSEEELPDFSRDTVYETLFSYDCLNETRRAAHDRRSVDAAL